MRQSGEVRPKPDPLRRRRPRCRVRVDSPGSFVIHLSCQVLLESTLGDAEVKRIKGQTVKSQ